MKPLEHPDSFHLRAAEGWVELGNHVEANAELEMIAPELRAHPEVLEVRWHLLATARKWEACVEIATAIAELVPEQPHGWIHRSFALHELKRTAEARDNLLPVLDQFPDDALMRYNLACYECQLGNLGEAKRWLETAFKLGGKAQIKLMAIGDRADASKSQ